MAYSQRVKNYAYALNPDVWTSYSGKDRAVKRALDAGRTRSLREAARVFGEPEDDSEPIPKPPELVAMAELLHYAHHSEACGDAASYEGVDHYCSCGLDALKERVYALINGWQP